MKRYFRLVLTVTFVVVMLSSCSSKELIEKESLILDLQSELTIVKGELEYVKNSEENYSKKYDAILTEKEKVDDKLNSINSELNEKNAKLEETQNILDNKTVEFDEMIAQFDELVTQFDEKEKAFSSLKREYDAYKTKMQPYEELNEKEAEARLIEAERIAAEDKAKKEKEAEEARKKKEAEEEKNKKIDEEKKRNAEGVPALPTNGYFKLIDTYTYSSGDYRHFIYVVEGLSKKDQELKIVVSDSDGNVLDTNEDNISLSVGKQNYFDVYIKEKFFKENYRYSLKIKTSDTFWSGDDDAVEYVRHNVSDNTLYITVKQTKANLGSFAQFKILYFNGTKLLDSDDGYFSIYADELDGVGSEAVIKMTLYGDARNCTSFSMYIESR